MSPASSSWVFLMSVISLLRASLVALRTDMSSSRPLSLSTMSLPASVGGPKVLGVVGKGVVGDVGDVGDKGSPLAADRLQEDLLMLINVSPALGPWETRMWHLKVVVLVTMPTLPGYFPLTILTLSPVEMVFLESMALFCEVGLVDCRVRENEPASPGSYLASSNCHLELIV